MSASGMRIRTRGRRGLQTDQRFNIRIEASCGELTAPVRVVWIRRIGFRSFEAGLEFHDLTAEMQSAVTAVARSAAVPETAAIPA